MSSKTTVFNDRLEFFGLRYITKEYPVPNKAKYSEENQKRILLAQLFEQFLLFDRIAIKISKNNLPLYFLIKELGIHKVVELLERDVLDIVLWTPALMGHVGIPLSDGTFDSSNLIGKPPFVAVNFGHDDPEENIDTLLSYFSLHRNTKRTFKKIALKNYILPDKNISSNAAEVIIDAYKQNKLETLGLKYIKEPKNLDHYERKRLSDLGFEVIETTFLAQKGYMSLDNYSFFKLTEESVKHIESACKISKNTSAVLKVENLADLKSLFLEGNIPFTSVFDLRYKSAVKQYRKWIHSISTNTDVRDVSKEYIDKITGKNKFFESSGGKFIRTVSMFALGAGIGATFGGTENALVGGVLGKMTEFGLGLFDTYILDGILKGWNPRMFIDEIGRQSNG